MRLTHRKRPQSLPKFNLRIPCQFPAPTAEPTGKKDRHEPRTEGRTEKIPFSCELAFSRLVRKGNFSTRCIAGLDSSKTAT